MIYCSCAEGKELAYSSMPDTRWREAHDCEYVRQRNRLIPIAERIADSLRKPEYSIEIWRTTDEWSQHFVKEMDRLAHIRGLTTMAREL